MWLGECDTHDISIGQDFPRTSFIITMEIEKGQPGTPFWIIFGLEFLHSFAERKSRAAQSPLSLCLLFAFHLLEL